MRKLVLTKDSSHIVLVSRSTASKTTWSRHRPRPACSCTSPAGWRARCGSPPIPPPSRRAPSGSACCGRCSATAGSAAPVFAAPCAAAAGGRGVPWLGLVRFGEFLVRSTYREAIVILIVCATWFDLQRTSTWVSERFDAKNVKTSFDFCHS